MRTPGLNQDLTYWAPLPADRYGVVGKAAPILLKGRWEEKNEEIQTVGGETITSAAIVYVDRPIGIGGYLAYGDLLTIADPDLTTAAVEVKAFQSLPDLRNNTAIRKAVL